MSRGLKVTWDCKHCGKQTTDYASQRKGTKGQFCSRTCARKVQMTGNKLKLGSTHTKEWRLMMQEKFSGSNCHLWRGGVTSVNDTIRKSTQYKMWRKAVFERDDYTCQLCFARGGITLNADHIKPFALYPELRFDIENGRTLCIDCHRQTDTYGNGSKLPRENFTVV